MENNKKSVFETLNSINVSGKTEKKNGLTYLSWAYAWAEVKKIYPNATYKVYERDTQYGPVNYFTDGMTCWVKVGVAIEGLEHVEMLPVMDYKNQAIPLAKVNACNVNKAVQRCITKAIGRHGLGLYVYAGEDYPDSAPMQPAQPANKPIEKAAPAAQPHAKAPARDTRLVTPQMVGFIEKTIEEHQITKNWICHKYKVSELKDLRVYQAKHIGKNISRLKDMFDNERREDLAAIVKNAKSANAKMETNFNDAILPQQPQEKTEGEEVTFDLSPEEVEALAQCGKIFS